MALGAERHRCGGWSFCKADALRSSASPSGILAAFGVTRVLESLLFGVQAFDAPTFIGMSAVMLAVALLASYLPAYRASSVDPMQALRTD